MIQHRGTILIQKPNQLHCGIAVGDKNKLMINYAVKQLPMKLEQIRSWNYEHKGYAAVK